MPLLESIGLVALSIRALRELCKEDPFVSGVVGNRADAGFVRGWSVGRRAFRKIRACWQTLDLPQNQVLQRAAAQAHWKSVCHVTVFYARTRGLNIEGALEKLGAPDWLTRRFQKAAPGMLAPADQDALHAVYRAALNNVATLPAPAVVDAAILDRLEDLFTHGRNGPHPAIEAAFGTLDPARDHLPEDFRAFFEAHWFDLLAVNFQELVRNQPGLAAELHSRWLAEIRIESNNGKVLDSVEWERAFDVLLTAFRESEGRIIDVVHAGTEAVLRKIDERLTPVAPAAGKPDTTPWAATDFFCGREELLGELKRALDEYGKASLWAEGGFGKTETALRYVDLNRHSYSAILWTDASTLTGFEAGYAAFAEAAGIAVRGNQEASLRNAQRWLENNDGWLIVLDNVDLGDGDLLLRALHARLPRTIRGHLLATTRHPSLAGLGRFLMIEVPPFSKEESVEFLKRRADREAAWGPAEEQAAGALADRLGGSPLALEQAAAYVEVNQGSFVHYLSAFTGIASLERQRPQGGRYPESVATTWRMNFEQVEKAHPASASILRASAWLAPAPIPLRFVEAGAEYLGDEVAAALKDDPGRALELLTPLARYSLIRRDRDSRTYWIHRLVAEVMRDRLGAEGRHLARPRPARLGQVMA